MDVVSLCPLRAASLYWRPSSGGFAITIICKGTFDLAPGELRLAEQQDDPNEDENYWDDDPNRSVRAPSDLVPFKPRADVVLVGQAFAPGKMPTRSLRARLAIGKIDKSIEVHGDRMRSPEGVREASFTTMHLRYERAALAAENPVGVRVDPRATGPLPNLQLPGRGFEVAGFGPLAPSWSLRRARLGRHAASFPPPNYRDQPIPEDIDPSFFNAAPADQQAERLEPGERLTLENLSAKHASLVAELPRARPRVFLDRGHGIEEIALSCDTLWIDTDRGVCTLTWRGQAGLHGLADPGRVTVLYEPQARPLTWAEITERCAVPSIEVDETHGGDDGHFQQGTREYRIDRRDLPRIAEALPFQKPTTDLPPARPAPPVRPPWMEANVPPPHTADGDDLNQTVMPGVLRAPTRWPEPSRGLADHPLDGTLGSRTSESEASRASRPTEARGPLFASLPPSPIASPTQPVPPPPVVAPGPSAAPLHTPAANLAGPPLLVTPSPAGPPPVPVAQMAPPLTVGQVAAPALTVGQIAAPPTLSPRDPLSGSVSSRDPLSGSAPLPPSPVLAASNLAADQDIARRRVDAKPAEPAPVAKEKDKSRAGGGTDVIDLLWFDKTLPDRVRVDPKWLETVAKLRPMPDEPIDDDPPLDPPEVVDKRDVFAVLTDGEPTTPDDLEACLAEATSPRGAFTPPLVVIHAELTLAFEELETLKATLQVAAPFTGGPDKRLKEAFDAATEAVKAWTGGGSGRALESLRTRVAEAFASANSSLPAGYLDQSVERALVVERRYEKRAVFGETWIRGLVGNRGAAAPAYLPDALGSKLPLFARFPARIIAEVHLSQEPWESHPAALKCLAVARVASVRALPRARRPG